ncbi:DNA-directed RNA polymerase subunit beta [Rhynchospora pubera]|uniref:DNA-directed RNA polymerase subunit beta n=1 Tax=Rhynchospora pubera TaxID=906938 RepID=A0AAV8EDZ7_9POAL|nr:DNA-directed RNA polymerase subunit beta [Rhynchospora pubera]
MAPSFARSTSLPPSATHKKSSYHVRSVSLPCPSHPLISNLEEQIQAVRFWAANPEGSSAWIEAGLAHIELLQIALEDFLQLPQTQDTLRQAASVDQLLDDLLQLVDAYGSFVSTILTLKECHSNVQSAFRRQDEVRIASFLKSQRHVEKEIAQLASGLRGISKCQHLALCSDVKEIEITGIIREAICTTAFATMAIFSGVQTLSAAASSKKSFGATRSFKKLAIRYSLKKCGTSEEENIHTFERFEELDECIRLSECFGERVFRSLINLRVSALNIITP